jgi:O-succinylbenzoic acid--CoA ligase
MVMLLTDWLARAAANYPDKLAVRCGGVDWTFAELDHQATKMARYLATLGVTPGDRVALLAGNGLPFIAVVHALTRLGATLVPLNTRLTVDELRWQLADVGAKLLLSDDHFSPMAQGIAQELPNVPHAPLPALPLTTRQLCGAETGQAQVIAPTNPSQIAYGQIDLDAPQAIIYTSGTTGQPKGAIITYGMQWWSAVGSALNLGHDPADRWLAVLPFFHIGGLSILWRSVIYGIGVVAHERFDPAAINQSIFDDEVTVISVVAVMVQRMLADLGEQRYPARFRCMLLGGGPAPVPLLEACAARDIPIVQTYGMTESCSQAVTLAPADALRKIGSAGRPLAAVQLRIVQPDGTEAAPNAPGEIQLRGPTITPGYANRPDVTARTFDAGGWFATGDLGTLDADGYLYMLDRRSDLIISGGENVYPAEIEATLLAHPAVMEAGVCGMADPAWGQVPVAFVVLQAGATVADAILRDFVAARLARYKVPRALYIVDALPRNAAGKLLRRELLGLAH